MSDARMDGVSRAVWRVDAPQVGVVARSVDADRAGSGV